jgi:GTP1/Obg family GTP-binding protein
MECLSSEETINNTFEIVRQASFSEKKSKFATEEEIINNFLDKVLEFQKFLNDKSEIIEDINDRLEKLTWLNGISENDLMQINTLIGSAKDLLSVLIRRYINLNFLRKKGIAKEAIKRFKSSIDSLRENIEDLESIFFLLPQMPEFNETSKQLSLV